MTLPEIRRGFPTYRSASGLEPARVAARNVNSRGFGISYDDVGQGPTIVLVSGFSQSGGAGGSWAMSAGVIGVDRAP
jgi:hypothetical protein